MLGNSLGGHIALYHTKMYPEKMLGLVITGSSGLYEKSMMGDGYPKRGNYEYIQNKTEEVFDAVANLALKGIVTVKDAFETLNNLGQKGIQKAGELLKDGIQLTSELGKDFAKKDSTLIA